MENLRWPWEVKLNRNIRKYQQKKNATKALEKKKLIKTQKEVEKKSEKTCFRGRQYCDGQDVEVTENQTINISTALRQA